VVEAVEEAPARSVVEASSTQTQQCLAEDSSRTVEADIDGRRHGL
jgi:hypothetical protein